MINTLLYRILLAIPTMLGVAVICFMLVQIAPGDPLVSVMPPDASEALRQTLMQAYGFDKPLPLQFIHWLWRALHGDLGMSVATGRPVIDEVMTAVAYSLRLALLATAIGFVLGSLFGFVAGYFRNSVIDRLASVLSVFGVSVPHYWLGMLLVILCSVKFALLPATGGGPIGEVGWQWDWAHLQFMLLPALTLSVIPTGIIARTVRSQVADILSRVYRWPARPRAQRVAHLCPCHEKCRAHRAGGDGAAGGLSDGRLDPCGDRFLLAGNRIAAQYRHFSARPAPAAGHHLGAGAVFRAAQPAGGYSADHPRPAY